MSRPYCKIVYGVAIPPDEGVFDYLYRDLRTIAVKEENRVATTPWGGGRLRPTDIPRFHYDFCGLDPYGGFYYIGIELKVLDNGLQKLVVPSPSDREKDAVQAYLYSVLVPQEREILGPPTLMILCGVA